VPVANRDRRAVCLEEADLGVVFVVGHEDVGREAERDGGIRLHDGLDEPPAIELRVYGGQVRADVGTCVAMPVTRRARAPVVRGTASRSPARRVTASTGIGIWPPGRWKYPEAAARTLRSGFMKISEPAASRS
jgi:hypothetical protein